MIAVSSVDAVSVEKVLLGELLEEDTRRSVIDSCVLDWSTASIVVRRERFVMSPLLYVGRGMMKRSDNVDLRIKVNIDQI
jgi:hypothetical protein